MPRGVRSGLDVPEPGRALLEPGPRTGRYRLAADRLVTDATGRSRISTADLAVALLDEAERPRHRRTRFTVGY